MLLNICLNIYISTFDELILVINFQILKDALLEILIYINAEIFWYDIYKLYNQNYLCIPTGLF